MSNSNNNQNDPNWEYRYQVGKALTLWDEMIHSLMYCVNCMDGEKGKGLGEFLNAKGHVDSGSQVIEKFRKRCDEHHERYGIDNRENLYECLEAVVPLRNTLAHKLELYQLMSYVNSKETGKIPTYEELMSDETAFVKKCADQIELCFSIVKEGALKKISPKK